MKMTVIHPSRGDGHQYRNAGHLESDVHYWKTLLRLQDWDLKVEQTRSSNLPDDVSGTCNPCLENKTAHIRLMDPIDATEGDWFPVDQEKVLVHELIHLHLEPFFPKAGTPLYFAGEQAIESITKALVALHRQIKD